MKTLEEYTPNELATLAAIIGIAIASKYTVNQQNVVGNFLEGVGQILLLIAAQAQYIQTPAENSSTDNGNSNSDGKNADLQKQINELKEHIKKFEDSMK
ncbi:hypothetical protein [Clostridium sp.]